MLFILMLLHISQNTNVEELVSSFSIETLKGMFDALHFGRTTDCKSMQEHLCNLAKEMTPEDPSSFIRDLQRQLPPAPNAPLNPNPIRHASPLTSDWKGIKLQNVGNTCYINAALNAILSVDCIRKNLDSMDMNVFTDGKMAIISLYMFFSLFLMLLGLIKVRDGIHADGENLRQFLRAIHGQFGIGEVVEERFKEGEQNCSSVCAEILLDYLSNVNGHSEYVNQLTCRGCSNPLGPTHPEVAIVRNLEPLDSVKAMISTSSEDIDGDFIHHCQVDERDVMLALAQIDEHAKRLAKTRPQFQKVLNQTLETSTGKEKPEATKANLHSLFKLKRDTMVKLKVNVRQLGVAVARKEERKISKAGDFLVISVPRDPRRPRETEPTPELTINGQQYIIRSTINHQGPSPLKGHYTASVYCQNKWYLVDDDKPIRSYSGKNPWPKFSTMYFYERVGPVQPPTPTGNLVSGLK